MRQDFFNSYFYVCLMTLVNWFDVAVVNLFQL